ncbi:ferric-dicitrate binding protein FerR, regulates iron transport through sigma-19 [Formosa sp. Hel1_31_208]|uniref:FecR family protein n=1 Tax=Formosa sp. Hel1_31_208 TaxID=1798225 RepID=UPI00087C900A|nr:FecR family protein [Formosa sp. Hel1_31_208]SDS61942.1 ferric-dicitrate binding protein FerR, regulates iron transport through sigma-19 [Formosa sp. Hel1_31_208]
MKEQNLHSDNETFLAKWMEGKLTDDELKQLVSEDDFDAFQKLRKGIDTHVSLESSTATSFAKIQRHISEPKVKVRQLNSNSWLIGIAASIILLFGLFSLMGDDVMTITTNYGEQKSIALLDGSEVIINSKSTISYNKEDWESNRSLTLDGEAYFKVKKGSTFTVNTENGSVHVLGTQFNVNSVSDYFEVVCFEGKVSVNTLSEDYILMPKQSVRRINGFKAEASKTAETDPSWIHGERTFKSVPLKYVIAALESQYDISIYTEQVDDTLIYTGSFTHEDKDVALQTVFKSLQIQYIEKEKGNIYLSTK